MTAITTRPLSDSVADDAAPGDSLLRFALRADATLTGFFAWLQYLGVRRLSA
jgi:hypothetical protein